MLEYADTAVGDGTGESGADPEFKKLDTRKRTNLFEVQLTILTPFPGTPLYDRLLTEWRIIEPGAWQKCTLFDVNFVPRHMSPKRLRQGLIDLAGRMYDADAVNRRRARFFEAFHRNGIRRRAAPLAKQ